MISIAINGLGRIGRAIFHLANNSSDIEVKYIYDIKDLKVLAYLLEHDSMLRWGKNSIELRENAIIANDKKSIFSKEFSDVDIVLECSGTKLDSKSLQGYLSNGAKRIILGAPPKDDMPIYIFGVNEKAYSNDLIISNASCTSNAIAPIINAISKKYRIRGGNITTIHPFNSDQVLLDNPHSKDERLSRNATQNIIPTKSSIASVLEALFGDNVGGFYGDSIRIPTSLVCYSNIDLMLEQEISKEAILELSLDRNIIGFDSDMLVSSDFIGDSRSGIIPLDLLKINGNLARIPVWFDNESGYANRMLDMIRLVAKGL